MKFTGPMQRTLCLSAFRLMLLIAWPLAACGADAQNSSPKIATASNDQPASAMNIKQLSITPRSQWHENYGYCGEVSMISAGLYFGQYVSQYDARAIASRNTPQYDRTSQLLPGVNALHAASQMHLEAHEWSGAHEADTDDFLVWVKQHVLENHPVMIGVYTNHYLFDGTRTPNAGDREYDHIVPVTSISSRHALTLPAQYFGDDVISFSDNGMWPETGAAHYLFSYPFEQFQKSRAQANGPSGDVYSLAANGSNYGVAIIGVKDEDHETLPVRLTVDQNDERPDIKQGSSVRPRHMPLVLTVEVSGIEPGKSYRLYRYNRMDSVPDRAFNANASKADKQWDIRGESKSTFVVSEKIWSDEVAVYRAVPADAK